MSSCIGRILYKLKTQQLLFARKFSCILRDGKNVCLISDTRNLIKIHRARKFCMKPTIGYVKVITISIEFDFLKLNTQLFFNLFSPYLQRCFTCDKYFVISLLLVINIQLIIRNVLLQRNVSILSTNLIIHK